jgi:hypothetical protein
MHLDLLLDGDETIKRAIPGIELAVMHLHAATPMPVRHEASALPIANEIGFQPARQTMLAAWTDEPIGNQHESAIGVRDVCLGGAEQTVKQFPQAQLLEQSADDQERAPGRGIENIDGMGIFTRQRWLAEQHPLQLRQQGRQQILATEIGDDSLLDLAVLAVRFDDADVLVDRAVGGRDFDGANEHAMSITTTKGKIKSNNQIKSK